MKISGFAMKINIFKLVFVCLAIVSILPFALPGFADDNTLQVQCVDSSGKPIRDVKVVIYNVNTRRDKDKKTDAQGEAEFTKLDDGVYRIYGHKDGFVPALYEPALLKGSAVSVSLKFEAGTDKKFYFEDPAEDAKATDLLRQAFEAYKQKKYPDAEKLFSQSLEINPSNAEALYYLSISYLQQSKYDQAIETLNKTTKLANIMKNLPSPVPEGKQNPYDSIIQNVQQLLKQLPAIKGEDALMHKKYDEAIAQLNEAIKGDPNNATYYADLAIALANLSRFDEALAAVDKAEQLKPGANEALKKNIAARKENAEIEKARSAMTEGNKLLEGGDAAAALKKFEEAKDILKGNNQAVPFLQIARAQAKLNQTNEALASFGKALELAPKDRITDFRNSFLQVYLDDKKFDQAVDILADPKTAGSKSPEEVLLEVAKAYNSKEPKLAETALERVLKINPENAEAYYELGELSYIDGKEKDSRTEELLTKYVEIGKDPAKLENAKNMLVVISKRSK
jgi:tetratricopeptide (TPR) repeat protein